MSSRPTGPAIGWIDIDKRMITWQATMLTHCIRHLCRGDGGAKRERGVGRGEMWLMKAA